MKWIEQTADVHIAPIDDYLQTTGILDALIVLSHLREGPIVLFDEACRSALLGHLRTRDTELGGLLIGRPYISTLPCKSDNAATSGCLVIVEDCVPSEASRSTRVSLAMGSELWTRARERMTSAQMVVGWYHSHPNLGVFFSSTDRRTQAAFFRSPYSVGLVVDWVRGHEAWFIGGRSAPVPGARVLVRHVPDVAGERESASTSPRFNVDPTRTVPQTADIVDDEPMS